MKYELLLRRLDDNDIVERSSILRITEEHSEQVGLRSKRDGSRNNVDAAACARLLEHLFHEANKTSKCPI